MDPYSYISDADAVRAARDYALDAITRLEELKLALAEEGDCVNWYVETARFLVESDARDARWLHAIGIAECADLRAAAPIARLARQVKGIEEGIKFELKTGQALIFRHVLPLPYVHDIMRALQAAFSSAPPGNLKWFYLQELPSLLNPYTLMRYQITREITPTLAHLRCNRKFRKARNGMHRCIAKLHQAAGKVGKFPRRVAATVGSEKEQIEIDMLREKLDAMNFAALRTSVMQAGRNGTETGDAMGGKATRNQAMAHMISKGFDVSQLTPLAGRAKLLVKLINAYFPIDAMVWPNDAFEPSVVDLVLNAAIGLDKALTSAPQPWGVYQGISTAMKTLQEWHNRVVAHYGWTDRLKGTAVTWGWEWPDVPRIKADVFGAFQRAVNHFGELLDLYTRPDGLSSEPPPRKWLESWGDIIRALGESRTRDFQRKLRRLVKLEGNCPIMLGKKQGAQPFVDKTELLEWWNRRHLEFVAKQQESEGAKLEAEDQYAHGRNGTVVPGIAGSVKVRRQDKR
jgi:hypothetical protein